MLSHLLVLAMLATVVPAGQAPDDGSPDPDRLYEQREDIARAREAAAIWAARLAEARDDFESAWKLARATYWIGGQEEDDARRDAFRRGIDAAERAVELAPDRPEGHFWLAANMGGLAEVSGMLTGLRYRGRIKDHLETVLAIDPAFLDGSADRALGKWYQRVPGLFGGSDERAVEYLQRSLTYDPASAASHFFLAETYLDMNREAEAIEALRAVLAAPTDTAWDPETRDFQRRARQLIEELEGKGG